VYSFEYHRPETLDKAAQLRADADDAIYLAGGQTLLPTLKQRLASPSDVIDLGSVAGLRGIQVANNRVSIGAMTTHAEVAASADVRRAIHELAPQYPIYNVKTMAERTAAATAPSRFSAVLLGLFALTALSLSTIGIYGVMALAVSTRTQEIGVRIALGADQRRVQRLVVGEGLGLVAVGAALGLVGALTTTRVLQSLLFDLAPTDPPTYIAIVVILGACAIAASWIPARRASRVDPVVALRAD